MVLSIIRENRSRPCRKLSVLPSLRRFQMMLRVKRAIGAYFLASALLPAIPVHAATYYVAPTGSNSNPGTEEQPWRTVVHAVNTMVAGDTTYVRGGVYIEGLIQFRRSGTQSAPIKLLNYPGESPVIDCNSVGTNMVLVQNANGFRIPVGYITFEGFEVRKCFNGFKYYHMHDSVLRRNWFHDNRVQGILGNGGVRNVIDRNVINANGSSGTLDHGIYANGRSMTITNNVIYDNMCFGIQQNGATAYDPSKHPGREFEESQDWIIANNTIAYERYCSAIVVWGPYGDNARIENNIFYENRVNGTSGQTNGIHFTWSAVGSTGIVIRNNLVYATGVGGLTFLGTAAVEGVNYTQSGNIVNTLNPKFINAPATLPPSPNFALAAQSPAIDAGLTITETKTDFLGAARPQGRAYDIGAYEYYGSSTSVAAPTSLQVVN
jgi:hypothetical protein